MRWRCEYWKQITDTSSSVNAREGVRDVSATPKRRVYYYIHSQLPCAFRTDSCIYLARITNSTSGSWYRGIEIETPIRIIFRLQSLQPGQPPRLISVQLLQGLVSVRIVHVRVHVSTPCSVEQNLTEVIAKGGSISVQ
jgi:hypothetical protein